MITVNMHEAKSRLSELVAMVEEGTQVVIARNGEPVAELVPHSAAPSRRRGGQWRGRAAIPDDFDAPAPDIEEMFGL